jgi:DNA-binding LacI/PurR family transcriptional regulator
LTIRAAIIAAVERDGRSIAAIAEAAGVPRWTLSEFLRGKRSANAETLDRVMAELGLRVTQRTRANHPRRG